MVLLPAWLAARTARAETGPSKSECVAASVKGQELERSHALLEAREQLRVCAQKTCPAILQSACGEWLTEVEKALPSVVITLADADGRALVDVHVSIAGRAIASTLNGESIALDPGFYVMHFETRDGRSLDKEILVKEGVRNQEVNAVLRPAQGAAPRVTPSEPVLREEGDHDTRRVVGWVTAATGVAGLGVGGVFGVKTFLNKASANCTASGACEGGELSAAQTSATVADVAFIAGGVLAAGGLALVFVSPKRSVPRPLASLQLFPVVGVREGGLCVGWGW